MLELRDKRGRSINPARNRWSTERRILLLLVALIGISGCVASNEDPSPSISGKVDFVDSAGNRIAGVSGGKVVIMNDSSVVNDVAISDSGRFNISDLTAGRRYVLNATAPGFGEYTWYTSTINAGDSYDLGDEPLIRLPRYTAVLDTLRQIDSTLYINGLDPNWSGPQSKHHFTAFCSLTSGSDLSFAPNPPAFQSWDVPSFTITVPLSTLKSHGIRSGQTVYFTLRAVTDYELIAPLQSTQGKDQYAAPGPASNEVTFVMP